MTGHKHFFESRVKIEEGTLREGVVKKDTRTRFRVKFVGKEDTEFGWVRTLWNKFSNKEPRERPTLGIQLIK